MRGLPPIPTKRPTPSEYAVVIVGLAAVLIVLGLLALVFAFRAPPDKQELAELLQVRGLWSLAIGIALAAAFWLGRRLLG